jgi:hypothetical protein
LILTSFPHFEIFQVFFCNLDATMSHKSRQFINVASLFHVHTCERVPECVSGNTNTCYIRFLFYVEKQLLYPIWCKRLPIALYRRRAPMYRQCLSVSHPIQPHRQKFQRQLTHLRICAFAIQPPCPFSRVQSKGENGRPSAALNTCG